jgi:hypothetical protein
LQPYVVSFSRWGDNLSQWRGYCGHGAGISLGFDSLFLARMASVFAKQNAASGGPVLATLARCLYDEGEQNEVIDKVIGFFLDIPDDAGKEHIKECWHAILTGIMLIAPTFKDKSFKDEAEWRILIQSISPTKLSVDYRNGQSMLIPFVYLPLKLDGNVLTEVTIGPTPHPVLLKGSTTDFLRSRISEYPPERVINSAVPFRHW